MRGSVEPGEYRFSLRLLELCTYQMIYDPVTGPYSPRMPRYLDVRTKVNPRRALALSASTNQQSVDGVESRHSSERFNAGGHHFRPRVIEALDIRKYYF